jgi:acyl-coenzyme A synthetase/AMP-(fatty) acid ligase
MASPSSIGSQARIVAWIVGHSYIIYAPLSQGATTLVYEGKPVGTPDPGAFWGSGANGASGAYLPVRERHEEG